MKNIWIAFIGFVLISCNETNSTSSIIGNWITDACTQLTDNNSQPVNVWAKSTYTFQANGDIYLDPTSYSDSNCITESGAIQSGPLLVATFLDLGAVTASQGMDVMSINITFTSAPAPYTTSGFYKITGGALCLSQAYQFNAGSFSISNADDTEIDFTHCLSSM